MFQDGDQAIADVCRQHKEAMARVAKLSDAS